jgi:single-strand DNA-binding protein
MKMSKSVNKVSLLGRLGRDPDLRFTGTGTPFCRLRIATNESFKTQDGEWSERTEWHTVVGWGRLAEICNEYLKKGDLAYFEGSLQNRSFEDTNGQTRFVTEIKLGEMILLGAAAAAGRAEELMTKGKGDSSGTLDGTGDYDSADNGSEAVAA